jgi:membrane protein implicated in regulation of membrane protease activity
MVVLVRIVLPIALVVAGGLILAFSGPIVIGIGLIVLAFFSVLTNFLIRLAISSQDDRDKEAAARERYIETGRWSSR